MKNNCADSNLAISVWSGPLGYAVSLFDKSKGWGGCPIFPRRELARSVFPVLGRSSSDGDDAYQKASQFADSMESALKLGRADLVRKAFNLG